MAKLDEMIRAWQRAYDENYPITLNREGVKYYLDLAKEAHKSSMTEVAIDFARAGRDWAAFNSIRSLENIEMPFKVDLEAASLIVKEYLEKQRSEN